MKYDFTSILDRTGKDAIAVEHIPIPGAQVKEGFDRIPMWVADMNFPTVPDDCGGYDGACTAFGLRIFRSV